MSRTQALQNRAFLNRLRRTGNVRLACREVGLAYSTMQDRRGKHPGFAVKWEAAVVLAQARLAKRGRKGPLSPLSSAQSPSPARGEGLSFRTAAGEPHLVRLKSGKLQMRRAQAGKLTPAAEQAFLAAVSATCNISLAAAAVGSCFNAFNRRRKKDPAFAREMRLALRRGYERLELALLASELAASHEHDDWRENDPPPIPPMTANQALQLLYLHQKQALMLAEPDYIKQRRGESSEAHSFRLSAMYEARLQQAREEFEVAEAARRAGGAPSPFGLRAPPALPDLAQVTGWSRADPGKAPHDASRALFGGWRMKEMEAKRDSRLRGNDERGE